MALRIYFFTVLPRKVRILNQLLWQYAKFSNDKENAFAAGVRSARTPKKFHPTSAKTLCWPERTDT
jgi:hypothetical protein